MTPLAMSRLLVIGVALSIAPSASAQNVTSSDPPSIVTQGEAIIQQVPDVAWIQIAVETRAGTPESARQQAATVMTSVVATLKKSLPADAIKTSAFSIQPEMEYPK